MEIDKLRQDLKNLEFQKKKAEENLMVLREQKSDIAGKMKSLKAKIRRRESAAARKARTHRLIQLGAELEKAAGGEIDLERWKKFVNYYAQTFSELKKEKSS